MPLTEKDRQLITDLLGGKPEAWNTFVDRYANLIIQVIRHTAHAHSLKLTQDDIDDLAAEVFATLLERDMGAIRGFRGRSSFATYLAVIVRRIVLRKLTQRRYMEAFGHVQAHQASLPESTANEHTQNVDAKDEVDSLMARLPENLRRILKAVYIEGLSYREVSERLRIPVNSVGPLIARAKSLVRQQKPAQH